MKTRFLLVLFCVILFSVSYAQNPSYKNQGPQPISFNSNTKASLNNAELAKLKEVYGAALKTEILDRPTRVLSIKEILRNRVILREITDPNKQKPCPKLSEIPLFDAFVSTLKRGAPPAHHGQHALHGLHPSFEENPVLADLLQ